MISAWRRICGGGAAITIVAVTSSTAAQTGNASVDEIALNGTYTAVSDGQWAKTNERYHDEATVTSTWTISSSCTGAFDCTGRVSSDLGWSADTRYLSGMWFVVHTVEQWQHCADGSTAPGKQIFKFYPDRSDTSTLLGWDTTTSPSGSCGRNLPLTIDMPFRLTAR